MNGDDSPPATSDALQAELLTLLRGAHENGIDVEGGWDCRSDGNCPDWDVVVTEVQKREASD